MSMFRLLPLLLLPALAAAETPRYFITVQNGAYNYGGGAAGLEESSKVLENMVKLADALGVRLTLLFSAQYALYISSSPQRLAALQGWKRTGHEAGAYHAGAGGRGWDGYSDLPGEELSRLRPDRKASGSAPGHGEFYTALARLEPAMKTGCARDPADAAFSRAAPPYEACAAAGAPGAAGVNEFVGLHEGGFKSLSAFQPADRDGIEAAKAAFSGMSGGVYGASFRSAPSEFGAFYAWLAFLKSKDPLGVKSRSVAAAIEAGLLPERKAARGAPAGQAARRKAAPAEAGKEKVAAPLPAAPPVWPKDEAAEQKQEIPRLKPVPSFFGRVGRIMFGPSRSPRGGCGDGVCDAYERSRPGSCPRDCGR